MDDRLLKTKFVSFLFLIGLAYSSFAQQLDFQLQVGETLESGEGLGNCITGDSYLIEANFEDPIVFSDLGVNVSQFGSVTATFRLQAPFDAPPGVYNGIVNYDIFQITGALCFRDTLEFSVEIVPAQLPVPEFKTFPLTVIEGANLSFENLTENPVESWLWDFGDGQTSTEKSPLHQFTTEGNYSVSLLASGPGGEVSILKENYITVVPPGTPGLRAWLYKTEGYVGSPGIGPDGTVYFSSDDGNTYAVDSLGNLKWTFNLAINTPKIGKSGTLYGTYGAWLLAIDTLGREKWRFVGETTFDEFFALDENETIFIGGRDGKLRTIDSTGTETGMLNFGADEVLKPIIGPDGTIYTTARFGSKKEIYAIQPNDGLIKWSTDESYRNVGRSDLAIDRFGNIVSSGLLASLDPDGNILWTQNRRYIITSQAVFDDQGNIYGVSGTKLLSFYGLTGELNWKLDFIDILLPIALRRDLSTPIIGANGLIYLFSKAGVAFAVNKHGEIEWQHRLAPDGFRPSVFVFDEAPMMDAAGKLLIGYDDGNLHAISTSSPGPLQDVWSSRGQNGQNTRRIQCPFPSLKYPANQTIDQAISIQFEWRSVFGVEKYEFQLSHDSAFSVILNQQIVEGIQLNISDLAYDTTFLWRVRPINESGAPSCWSGISTFSTLIAPPRPTLLSAPENGTVGISKITTLRWMEADDSDLYHLQFAMDSSFNEIIYDEKDITKLFFTVSVPDFGTLFYWRVRGKNSTGFGEWSETWSYQTVFATNISKNNFSDLSIYPNPTVKELIISFYNDLSSPGELRIKNSQGITIMQSELFVQKGENIIKKQLEKYPPGIYYVKIALPHKSFVRPFLLNP